MMVRTCYCGCGAAIVDLGWCLLVILIGVQFSISTYAVGASLLAALSVVLESFTNRCMKLVNRASIRG